jgi:hypothetical protein
MFTKREQKHTYVDELIVKATLEIKNHDVNSEEYNNILDRITKLQKIRVEEREFFDKDLPSADTILTVAANLLGIVMIINHEHLHPITTRAMNMLQKPK